MVVSTDPTYNLRQWRACASGEHVRHGRQWYAQGEARRFVRAIAHEHALTIAQAAGITAAYSPHAAWGSNKTTVRRFLASPTVPLGLGRSYRQACAILAGARPLNVLTGPKVRAFYAALMGDKSAVVVDLWHTRAALGHDRLTTARRAAITEATRTVAAEFGDYPRDCQAIIWCSIRGKHD